jgi:protein tyrosine phosphatase (PTP) superfamily phosphohydrolase (DUF442 family)
LATVGAGALMLVIGRGRLRKVERRLLKGVDIGVSRMREQGWPTTRLWIRDHVLRWVEGVSPVDTSRVTDAIFVGGQIYRRGLARLADRGITASVNLRGEMDDRARGVALARHLWLPTKDDTPPTLDQLDQAVTFIRESIEEGHRVYVHCAAGVGRAPTVAAAYLVSAGLTPPAAWAQVHRARPFIRPKVSQVMQVEQYSDGRQEARN